MDQQDAQILTSRLARDGWSRAALLRHFAAMAVEPSEAEFAALKADAALVQRWRDRRAEADPARPDSFADALAAAQDESQSGRASIGVSGEDISFASSMDGLLWTYVHRRELLAEVETVLGRPFGPNSDAVGDRRHGFVLRDADGVPLAVLAFDRADILRCGGRPYAAGADGGSVPLRYAAAVARDGAALCARLALVADLDKEIPDGVYGYQEHRNAYTVHVKNGVIHDPENPAVNHRNGVREWWRDGRRDRSPGLPAVEHLKGRRQFWRDGRQVADAADNVREIASALYAAAILPPSGKHDPSPLTWFRRCVHKAEAAVAAAGVAWSSDAAHAIVKRVFAVNAGVPLEVDRMSVLGAKCLLLGRMVADGDFDAVPVSDRSSLLRLLGTVPADALPTVCGDAKNGFPARTPLSEILDLVASRVVGAVAPPLPAVGGGPLQVLHVWSQKPPRGAALDVHSTTTLALDTIPESEAPVFASLPRPDGGQILLRLVDGDPYRPLLAPGGWAPATEAEVRAAAGDGAGWRDAPHFPAWLPDACALSVRERSAPAARRSAADAEAEAASADACVARAGRLVVIGGVVHRRTEFPRIVAVATEAYDYQSGLPVREAFKLTWRLGDDLSGVDDQTTVARLSDRHPVWNGFFGLADVVHGGETGESARLNRYAKRPTPEGLSFPADGQAAAAALLSAVWTNSDDPDFDPAAPLVSIRDPSVCAQDDHPQFPAVLWYLDNSIPWFGARWRGSAACRSVVEAAAEAARSGDAAECETMVASLEQVKSKVVAWRQADLGYDIGLKFVEALLDSCVRALRDAPVAEASVDDEALFGLGV